MIAPSTSRSYIATSRDFKEVSRPLRGPVESVAERALRSGSPSLRPLSGSSGTREDHFPGSVTTTFNQVGHYCVITPGHFSLVISTCFQPPP